MREFQHFFDDFVRAAQGEFLLDNAAEVVEEGFEDDDIARGVVREGRGFQRAVQVEGVAQVLEFVLFAFRDEVFGNAKGVYGAGGFHSNAFVGEDFGVEGGVVGHQEVVFEEFLEAGAGWAALEFDFVRDHFWCDVVDGHRAKGDGHAGGRFEIFVDAFAGGRVFVGQLEEAGVRGFVRGFGVQEEEGHGGKLTGAGVGYWAEFSTDGGLGEFQDVFTFWSWWKEYGEVVFRII